MSETKPTHAIVLAGGASHGAYHVGVLKALLGGHSPVSDVRLDPNIIAGISAGALNAAVLLSQLEAGNNSPAEYLERVWLKTIAESKKGRGNGVFRVRGDASDLLHPTELLRQGPFKTMRRMFGDVTSLSGEALERGGKFLVSSEAFQRRLLKAVDLSSFVSMKPFKKTIRKSVQFDQLHRNVLHEGDRKLRIGAVNWKEGKMHYFTRKDMNDDEGPEIIRASAAVPGVFPRVNVFNDWFCDGMAVENTPLSAAIAAGADVIHVVTSVPPVNRIPVLRTPNTLDTLYRSLIIRAAATLSEDIERARTMNLSLDCIEVVSGNETPTDEQAKAFMKTAKLIQERFQKKKPYRKLTIHVYRPPTSLGGLVGLLNFDRKFLRGMIDTGYDDTAGHNCAACVLPDKPRDSDGD